MTESLTTGVSTPAPRRFAAEAVLTLTRREPVATSHTLIVDAVHDQLARVEQEAEPEPTP